MAAAVGQLTALGLSADDITYVRYDFQRESVTNKEAVIDGNGLRGTFTPKIERVRAGLQDISGQLVFQPTVTELTTLLPWIHGAAASGTDYPLSDSQLSRYLQIDRISKVFKYSGCVVDRATFRASQGEPLELTLDVVGLTETVGNSGTFPAVSIDTTVSSGPLVFTDLALVVNSVTVNAREIEVVIDNGVDRNRYFNSVTRISAPKQNRVITVRTSLPYGDASAAYNTGMGGVAVTATYTYGTVSLLQSFVKVVFPRQSPMIEGRSEIMIPLEGRAYGSSSTLELVTTLDSTV